MGHGDVETFLHRGEWKNRIQGDGEVFGTPDADRPTAVWEGRMRALRDGVGHVVLDVGGKPSRRIDYARLDAVQTPE